MKRREPAPNKKEEKREATQRKSVRELASKLGNVPMGGPPKKKGIVLFHKTSKRHFINVLLSSSILLAHQGIERIK